MKKPPPKQSVVDPYEHVHFRVGSELRKIVDQLKEFGDFKTDAEYFCFLIRQEWKTTRVTVVKPK